MARFGQEAGPALREQVGTALVNKGVTAGRLGPFERRMAAGVYDEVVARFGQASPDWPLREQVAHGAGQQGHHAGRSGPAGR